MTPIIFVQVAVYVFLEIVPCVILSAAPFRTQIRSKKMFFSAAAFLYLMGIVRRLTLLFLPSAATLFSVLWILLYFAAFKSAVRASTPKILFVLISVLNYASLIAILYSYAGHKIFSRQLEAFPYRLEASLTILIVSAAVFPFVYRLMRWNAAPILAADENDRVWRFLWFVPAIFCIIFYNNLFAYQTMIDFVKCTRNFIVSIVTILGCFFVLSLVLRSVSESNLILHLQSENHRLTTQTLQYENLKNRMEEARRARHDLRHFTAVLTSYLQTGDLCGLKEFAARYCAESPPDTAIVYSRHLPLNALITYYADLAAERQIAFSAEVEEPDEIHISDIDLVVLLGNLLENALEACSAQSSGDRFISLSIHPRGGAIVITLDNSFEPGRLLPSPNGFRSTKQPEGGIGIPSVRQIVDKNGGVVRFEHDGGRFYASVMLQNP